MQIFTVNHVTCQLAIFSIQECTRRGPHIHKGQLSGLGSWRRHSVRGSGVTCSSQSRDSVVLGMDPRPLTYYSNALPWSCMCLPHSEPGTLQSPSEHFKRESTGQHHSQKCESRGRDDYSMVKGACFARLRTRAWVPRTHRNGAWVC